MSMVMEEDVKRWTARRKSALVLEIIHGKTTIAEAARSYDLTPSEIEEWVDWFNNRRLLEPISNIPPAEAEERYYAQLDETKLAA